MKGECGAPKTKGNFARSPQVELLYKNDKNKKKRGKNKNKTP